MKNPKITPEEVKVIKAAQEGDKVAFSRLFEKYKGFVSKVIFNYIKDMDEAQDLANVVFLKVHDKLNTFQAYDSFGGWLRIIANRTAIDYLRENKHVFSIIDDEDVRLAASDSISSDENDLVNHLTYEQILKEFNKLSENAQKVCELFYMESLTTEQIGKALNMPQNTVKSHLLRARSKLKPLFKTF